MSATTTPAPASIAGYGSDKRRATCSKNNCRKQEQKQAFKKCHSSLRSSKIVTETGSTEQSQRRLHL